MGQALLVAEFDAAQVEDGVLHGDLDALAASGVGALVEGGQDPRDGVDAGAGVADLRAGGQWRAAFEAGGGHGAAHGLGDDLVGLERGVGAVAEALDGGVDDPRVDLLDPLPGEAHAVDRAGPEVLHHHVAAGDQVGQDLPSARGLGVERDAALVRVEHREVQAVRPRHVP